MWPERGEPATLAQTLLADAEFKALRLADLSQTQQGQLIIEAVEMLTPPLYRQDERLIAAALSEAVTLQRQGQVAQARGVALAAVIGAGLLALWWWGGAVVAGSLRNRS